MTIPLILLAIYAGIFAVSLVLSSYSGHAHPAPEHVRRVADAVERASLTQLLSPAKWSMGMAALYSLLGAKIASTQAIPIFWPLALPPLVAVATLAAVFFGARVVHRGVAQSVPLSLANLSLVHSTRNALAAVLLTGAITFFMTLGCHTLFSHEIGAEKGRFLVLLSSATVATVSMILARAAAASALTVEGGVQLATIEPNGGSLAYLVSSSFQAPMLRLSLWMTLSALGHATLVLALPEGGASWLYPHLLQLLGLLAVGFGALVARMGEDETSLYAWFRAGLVTLTLLTAGTWSLSSQLPDGTSRTIPSGLTFFFLSLAIAVWCTPFQRSETSKGPASTWFVPTILLASLVTGLSLTLTHAPSSMIPTEEVGRLLSSGALAALPIVVLWTLTARFDEVKQKVARLAFSDAPSAARPQQLEMNRLVGILPALAAIVALGALGRYAAVPTATPSLLHLGLGAFWGLLLGATASNLVNIGTEPFQQSLGELVKPQESVSSSLDLEAASGICATAIATRGWLWLATALSPVLVCALLRKVLAADAAGFTVWGLGLGLLMFGVAHSWWLSLSQSDSKKMFGTMSLVTCVAQVLLMSVVESTT